MIYFQSKDQKHVLLLSPEEVGGIMHGELVVTPDNLVMVAYTPDGKWMVEELKKVFDGPDKQLTAEKFNQILREGLKRTQI